MKLNIAVSIDSEEIGENLTQEEAFKIIEEIDDAQVDYDFTLRVARNCVKKLIACCEGSEEPFRMESLLENET